MVKRATKPSSAAQMDPYGKQREAMPFKPQLTMKSSWCPGQPARIDTVQATVTGGKAHQVVDEAEDRQ